MSLPIIQSPIKEVTLLQTLWSPPLNQLLTNPLLNGLMLPNVILAVGDNVINHRLGRTPQGYLITRYIGAATVIYDKQSTNKIPDLTLVLNSTVATTVNLYVF